MFLQLHFVIYSWNIGYIVLYCIVLIYCTKYTTWAMSIVNWQRGVLFYALQQFKMYNNVAKNAFKFINNFNNSTLHSHKCTTTMPRTPKTWNNSILLKTLIKHQRFCAHKEKPEFNFRNFFRIYCKIAFFIFKKIQKISVFSPWKWSVLAQQSNDNILRWQRANK